MWNGPSAAMAEPEARLAVPADGQIRVAFLIDTGATVIDFAGPWEAFQDADAPGDQGFVLYTVGPSIDPVRVSGPGLHRHKGGFEAAFGGFEIVPEFSFEDAPQPQVLVIGAQGHHNAAKLEWIQRVSGEADVVLSICTGAFLLARTGLLDGLAATTHHDFYDSFASEFPRVRLVRGERFVDNGAIVTAGGLTSGIDGALHVIARYFGPDVAAGTARMMELTQTPRSS